MSAIKWFLIGSLTIFWGLFLLIGGFLSQKASFLFWGARLWSRWCLGIAGIDVNVSGLEKINPDTPYVITANHQGQMDILVLIAIMPIPFLFIAKKELFKIPFFGWNMSLAGHISVDRSNHDSSLQSMKVAASKIQSGRSVMFFPEGTRSEDGKLKRFKSGAFYLSLETQAPILPVVIDGSFRAMPKGTLKIQPTEIHVRVLHPIETKGKTVDSRDELKQDVWQRLKDGLKENQGTASFSC